MWGPGCRRVRFAPVLVGGALVDGPLRGLRSAVGAAWLLSRNQSYVNLGFASGRRERSAVARWASVCEGVCGGAAVIGARRDPGGESTRDPCRWPTCSDDGRVSGVALRVRLRVAAGSGRWRRRVLWVRCDFSGVRVRAFDGAARLILLAQAVGWGGPMAGCSTKFEAVP